MAAQDAGALQVREVHVPALHVRMLLPPPCTPYRHVMPLQTLPEEVLAQLPVP